MHIPPIGALLGYLVFMFCVAILILCVFALIQKNNHIFQWIKKLSAITCLIYLVSILSLAWLITTNAFEYKLVYEVANLSMPLHQKLSGLWANQNSSLNFWCFLLVLANWLSLKLADKYQSDRGKLLTSLIFIFLIIVFMVPVVFIMNPFARLWVSELGIVKSSVWVKRSVLFLKPDNGIGLNPNLRHPAMLVHPPLLYLGLIGFFIPYTHAISTLLVNAPSDAWQFYTKPISLFTWACLTAGMALGSWWAYTILGWGGYWGWDAVEIAGLIPWLLSIGFLHSFTKKRNDSDSSIWPYIFISCVFIFTLMGIFITRSGILESVHAYAKGPVGPILSLLVIIFSALTIFLFISHRKHFLPETKTSWLTISHYLLITLSLFYFVGQTFPITSQIFNGKSKHFSTAIYKTISMPLIFLILVGINQRYFKNQDNRQIRMKIIAAVVMAIFGTILFSIQISANLIPIIFFAFTIYLLSRFILEGISVLVRTICAGNLSGRIKCINFNRIGGHFLHFGFVLMLIGIMGVEHGAVQTQIVLSVGEQATIEDMTITSVSKQQFRDEEPRASYENGFELIIGDKRPVRLYPHIDVYERTDVRISIPAIHTTIWKDVQVVLQDWGGVQQRSTITVLEFPLAIWLWTGCGVMVLGAILSLVKTKPSNG